MRLINPSFEVSKTFRLPDKAKSLLLNRIEADLVVIDLDLSLIRPEWASNCFANASSFHPEHSSGYLNSAYPDPPVGGVAEG